MPSLLTPGVYIQEVALGPSPIQGVSTSVAGFVGEAERGRVNGPPSLVTSFADFQRQYGNFVAGKALAYAVQGFFANGGQQAFIARVASATAAPASVVPELGYDVAIQSFSTVAVAAGVAFTIRAATVVGVPELNASGGANTVQLIDRRGNVVATLLVVSINPTAGSLVVTSNVPLGPPSSNPPLSPAAYALRYAGANVQPTPVFPQIYFSFSARDPGVFGDGIRVLLTPTYLATAVIGGVSAGLPTPAYVVNNAEPFEVGAQVELAKASSPSGRTIQTVTGILGSTITLDNTTTLFAVGDYVRALGWTLQVYYNGVLVETLTGISSNNSGSDGLSSINTNSQWVTVPPYSPNVTYPSFDVNSLPGPAVATGTVNLATSSTLYGASGSLAGASLMLQTDSSANTLVTFPASGAGGVANQAALLAAITAATNGSVIASTNTANALVLSSLDTGTTAALTIGAPANALGLLGLSPGTTPGTVGNHATATGTVDTVATSSLYGTGAGSLAGTTFSVQSDGGPLILVAFPAGGIADHTALLPYITAALNAATPPGTVTAQLNGSNQLQLLSLHTGVAATITLTAGTTTSAVASLGLTAGTSHGSGGTMPTPSVVTGSGAISGLPASGNTLQLQTDAMSSALTINFATAPATNQALVDDINNATGNNGAIVASLTGSTLVLTSQTTGPTALITVVGSTPGSVVTNLGFTANETGTPGTAGSAMTVWNPAGVSIPLGNGSNGGVTNETDVIGSSSLPLSGLAAMEAQEGVDIIAVPGWVSGGNGGLNDLVITALIGQAERKQDRFAVFEAIDYSTDPNVDVNRLLAERGKWNSQYAAMYAPYVEVLDPLSNTVIPMPASGHIVGAYANTDNLRGVFKSPANVVLQGISGFSRAISTGEQDLLNPAGVNVLRNFPGLGNVIWGARTIAADPLWKYVSVRRLFIFIEQSLVQGTRYAVFEPNDLKLWARLRDSVRNFLTTQWQAGALFGATAAQAFFVRVDETTTTQDDRDNGIVNILVGIAPVKPAEFIVFQIGQAPESVIIAEQGS